MAAAGHPGEDARLFEAVKAIGLELCPQLGIAIPVGKDSMSMKTVWERATEATSALGQDSEGETEWESAWEIGGEPGPRRHEMAAPLSPILSAVAPVTDARRVLTPELRNDQGASELLLIDLGRGRNRLGASALAQVYEQLGDAVPDVDDPALLRGFFAAIQQLNQDGLLLAYHDRSDGGLLVTLCEMAFAGRCGLDIDLGDLLAVEANSFAASPRNQNTGHIPPDESKDQNEDEIRDENSDQNRGENKALQYEGPRGAGEEPGSSPHTAYPSPLLLAALFAEELGAVVQVRTADIDQVIGQLLAWGLGECVQRLGHPRTDQRIEIRRGERLLLAAERAELQRLWAETSYQMQRLRDNPDCADEEFARIDADDPGLGAATLSFDPSEDIAAPLINTGARPRLAVLREQGVNGQLEMAAAFDRAGFACIDVHMSDILSGHVSLADFRGLAACGGFSYGDVLGAGQGWAQTILFNARARDEFAAFFARPETFALGVCNGCQMLSSLRELIPGAEHWPRFARNRSEQFEARLSLVEVTESPSILLRGMVGSRLPIAVAHGEGRAVFASDASWDQARALVALRYTEAGGEPGIAAGITDGLDAGTGTGIGPDRQPAAALSPSPGTERYPANPNGSPEGITALTSSDGRVTIMMPHPERLFRTLQYSWHPPEWGEDGPWLRLFRNARLWVG